MGFKDLPGEKKDKTQKTLTGSGKENQRKEKDQPKK